MSNNRKIQKTRHAGVYKRGDTYVYYFDEPRRDGKRRQRTGTARTLKAAVGARAEKMAKVSLGTYVEPSKVTLADYVTRTWYPAIEASELRANSVSFYRNRMDHVLPVLGDYRMSELGASSFDRLWQKLAEGGMSRASLQGTKTTARKLFDHARRKGVVPRNPVIDSDLPRVEGPKRTEWWSPAELGTWLRSTEGDRLGGLWALLGSTGMRRGEALALRWSDLDGSKVRVTKSRIRVADGAAEGEPKTQAGRRTIGLDARTTEALARWRKAQATEKLAFGPGYDPDGHMFTDEAGRPLDPGRVSRLFLASARRAGLRTIRLHDVRHSWASAAIEHGMGIKGVSERLGHSKVQVTLDLYVHTGPEADQSIADAMGALLWGTGS